MQAIEKYVHLLLFIMLYKEATFEVVAKILKCDHSYESYWVAPSCGSVYYHAQGGSNFQVWLKSYCCRERAIERYFIVVLFNMLYRVVPPFSKLSTGIFFSFRHAGFLGWKGKQGSVSYVASVTLL